MGWPLAVSAGLMERSSHALVAALGPLTVGHLLAMLVVILPFSLLLAFVQWHREIQIGASLLVMGFGIFLFINLRHPRVLARIRPTQLALWSFAVAIAHGAGLMLVPIYLGLCHAADLNSGHEAAGVLINANLGMAVLVSVVHSVTTSLAGLPVPGSQVRVAELVQSGCNLGLQRHIGWRSLGCDQPGEPALSQPILVLDLSRAGQQRPRVSNVVLFPAPRWAMGRVAVSLRYRRKNRMRRPDRPDFDFCFGSRAAVVARLMGRPVCPQLRNCRVRPSSYAWCREQTFTADGDPRPVQVRGSAGALRQRSPSRAARMVKPPP
jgi:hypothetical protein